MKPKRHLSTSLGGEIFVTSHISESLRFYTDFRADRGLPLTVLAGGRERCDAGYSVQRGNFPVFCLEYVVAGYGTLELSRKTFRLAPGSVFAYGPGVSQSIRTGKEGPLIKAFIDFTGPRALSLLRQAGLAPGNCRATLARTEVASLFEAMIAAGRAGRPSGREVLAGLMRALLHTLADTLDSGDTLRTGDFAWYQKSRNLMDRDYLKLHSLADTARACGVSKFYLCRAFKKYEHISPHQYLLRRKMSHAADLLQSGGLRVKDVAAALGYEEQNDFSRTFKRVFGAAPENYYRTRP